MLLAVSIAVWPGVAGASGSLRCGSYLVSIGDPVDMVRARCGPPSYRYDTATGVVWIYNFGSNRFLEQLRFLNGRLADITSHGYGFKGSFPKQAPPSYPLPPEDLDLSPHPLPYRDEGPLYGQYVPFRNSEHRHTRPYTHRNRAQKERHERVLRERSETRHEALADKHHEGRDQRRDEKR